MSEQNLSFFKCLNCFEDFASENFFHASFFHFDSEGLKEIAELGSTRQLERELKEEVWKIFNKKIPF